jgi:hypothetical protein
MPNKDTANRPGFKMLAIAVSAVLVAALAVTGIVAYGQNYTDNTTSLGETNATNTTDTGMNETGTAAIEEEVEEEPEDETFTASAEPDSQCSSVITAENGNVSLNNTVTMTAEALSDETMTAGLNDTQIASLDQLIENACSAIREGKSVTALGHLQTARDILSAASETEVAEEPEAEDEDEPDDIDVEDEEDEGFEEE